VTLKIATPQGAPAPVVTIDGATIPEGALDVPRKVNPGAHVAVATSGDARSQAQFSLAESEAREVAINYPVSRPVSLASPAPEVEIKKPTQGPP
jgi:hypothetical protein